MVDKTKNLAINDVNDFVFGISPKPVFCGKGLSIGAGKVVPEINFTLPAMTISQDSWPEAVGHYNEILDGVIKRAIHLELDGLLVEFETLPEMTNRPAWGIEIVRLIAEKLEQAKERHGLACALRFTPNDIREFTRPPVMRSGQYWDRLTEVVEQAAEAGADMLAIESTGGKEVCDDALVNCDLLAVVFALGALGGRDMRFLWDYLVGECEGTKMVASGDTACGFANTAMVLAEQRIIPRVFAAVVRVAAVARTLEAVEAGAVGPTKDCAYEGPYIKAIAGVPISMEGKSAACAHLSTVGNVSAAVCDCWSNESTPNVRLLSAIAPVVSLEELVYDCRLMNTALEKGKDKALMLRNWLSDSDRERDPQAYVLCPDVVLRISSEIVKEESCYSRTLAAVNATIKELRNAQKNNKVVIRENELKWLDILEAQNESLPDNEQELLEQLLHNPEISAKFKPKEYGF